MKQVNSNATSWSSSDNALRVRGKGVAWRDVRQTGLDTKEFRPHEQYDVWRDTMANIGALLRPTLNSDPFSASAKCYFSSSLAFARHNIEGQSRMERHDHHIDTMEADIVAVQLRIGGQELENSFRTDRLFQVGDIRVSDFAQPMSSANVSYDNLSIMFDKKELSGRLPGLDQLHGFTMPGGPTGEFLKQHMLSVFELVPQLDACELEKVSKITLETLTFALQTSVEPSILGSDSMRQSALELVHHYIRRHFHNPSLSPAQIASAIGVSRAKLYQLCKPYGTPMELVRHMRLKEADSLLAAGTARTVEEAAFLVGYENRSSFTRAFKSEFGVSPSDRIVHQR